MLDRQQLERLVRQFPENGLKVLLENSGNVHDVLRILAVRYLARIDFDAMRVEPAHFVERDYSHLACDVVLSAPLKPAGKGKKQITALGEQVVAALPDRAAVKAAFEQAPLKKRRKGKRGRRGGQIARG